MTDEIKKLLKFLVVLTITPVSFIFSFLAIPVIIINLKIISSIIYIFGIFIGDILLFSVVIIFIFVASLLTISKSISQIGIYHKLKNSENERGETFFTKFRKVFLWNCILTVFVFITIIDFIKPTSEIIQKIPALTQNDIAFISATVIIPGYLLSLRLLANPGKWIFNFPRIGISPHPGAEIEFIKIFKERILSFYFSLTGVVFIYIVIKYLYEGIKELGDPNQFTAQFLKAYTPHLPILIILILPYFVALALTTLFGEFVLREMEPIDQI